MVRHKWTDIRYNADVRIQTLYQPSNRLLLLLPLTSSYRPLEALVSSGRYLLLRSQPRKNAIPRYVMSDKLVSWSLS